MERRAPFRRSGVKDEVEQMFLGQYQHSLDNKGRLTIPSRFREVLVVDGAFITQGFDRNLMVLTTPTFEQVYRRVNALVLTHPDTRKLMRFIFSNAEQVDVDKVGRVLIPERLRQMACLENDAVVVGVGEFFEVWSPRLWQEQATDLQDAEANEQRFALLNLSLS